MRLVRVPQLSASARPTLQLASAPGQSSAKAGDTLRPRKSRWEAKLLAHALEQNDLQSLVLPVPTEACPPEVSLSRALQEADRVYPD